MSQGEYSKEEIRHYLREALFVEFDLKIPENAFCDSSDFRVDFDLGSVELTHYQMVVLEYYHLDVPSMSREEWKELATVGGLVEYIHTGVKVGLCS